MRDVLLDHVRVLSVNLAFFICRFHLNSGYFQS
jgi:hypothetical protein